MIIRLVSICYALIVCSQTSQAAKTSVMPQRMLDMLKANGSYDKKEHPSVYEEHPTNVTISMYIEGMSTFRATSMDFQLDVYFQQRWQDRRLRHEQPKKVLIKDVEILDLLWKPDLYFANAKAADYHDITSRNFLVWIENDGQVFYDTRISLVVICMMKLAKWPLDSQKCNVRIMSYAYDEEQMTIEWKYTSPIEMNTGIRMPDMNLISSDVGSCDGNYSTGIWSCVTAEFHVEREITHHITQSYIPSALIVVISWFSFWLDIDAVPARVSLSITTLLTLSTQANAARMALPEVSYMKAIDVWMGTCLSFVFGAMIEFTCANYVQRQGWVKFGIFSVYGQLKFQKLPLLQMDQSMISNVSQTTNKSEHQQQQCNCAHEPSAATMLSSMTTSTCNDDDCCCGEQTIGEKHKRVGNTYLMFQLSCEQCELEQQQQQALRRHAVHFRMADVHTNKLESPLACTAPNGLIPSITSPTRRRPSTHCCDTTQANNNTPDTKDPTTTSASDRSRSHSVQSSITNNNVSGGGAATSKAAAAMSGRLAAQRIDMFSRYFFPTTFFVFNVVYWLYYLKLMPDFEE